MTPPRPGAVLGAALSRFALRRHPPHRADALFLPRQRTLAGSMRGKTLAQVEAACAELAATGRLIKFSEVAPRAQASRAAYLSPPPSGPPEDDHSLRSIAAEDDVLQLLLEDGDARAQALAQPSPAQHGPNPKQVAGQTRCRRSYARRSGCSAGPNVPTHNGGTRTRQTAAADPFPDRTADLRRAPLRRRQLKLPPLPFSSRLIARRTESPIMRRNSGAEYLPQKHTERRVCAQPATSSDYRT